MLLLHCLLDRLLQYDCARAAEFRVTASLCMSSAPLFSLRSEWHDVTEVYHEQVEEMPLAILHPLGAQSTFAPAAVVLHPRNKPRDRMMKSFVYALMLSSAAAFSSVSTVRACTSPESSPSLTCRCSAPLPITITML